MRVCICNAYKEVCLFQGQTFHVFNHEYNGYDNILVQCFLKSYRWFLALPCTLDGIPSLLFMYVQKRGNVKKSLLYYCRNWQPFWYVQFHTVHCYQCCDLWTNIPKNVHVSVHILFFHSLESDFSGVGLGSFNLLLRGCDRELLQSLRKIWEMSFL